MPQPLRTDVRGGSKVAPRGLGWVRTTVITLLAAFATFLSPLASPAAAASAPADFAGLGDWNWPTTAESAQLGSDGVRTVRANVAWDWVEHTQGQRQWGGVDNLMRDAAKNGYDLLVVFNGCVAWSCGATRVAPQTDEQRAQFLSFVRDAASRYGAGGSYWAAHPELARIRVNWQVWNEVNVGADWPNPTAAGYQQLLAQTNWTIKSVDPSATVVTSGLAEFPAVASGQTLVQFLTGLEQDPAFRQSADVVAIHGYASDAAGTARILDATRNVMLAAGDNRPIWVTEFGWASGGPAHRFVRDAAGQAAELRAAYDLMVGCRSRWGLQRAYWFSLGDVSPEALGEPDYWGMHTGLYTADGQAKPALDAFREYLAGKELPNGRGASCPLAGGSDPAAVRTAVPPPPVVSIVQAPKYVGKDGRAQVDFVTNMGDAGNAECSLNGGGWAPCATPYVIPKNLGEGQFSLQVRAIDANGIRSTVPAVAAWTVDLTAPKTIFKKKPPKRIRSRAVTVRLGVKQQGSRLEATSEDVTFQCKLNRGKWKSCKSKQRVKASKTGKQLLRIRAVDAAGNIDYRGAKARFVVARKSSRR